MEKVGCIFHQLNIAYLASRGAAYKRYAADAAARLRDRRGIVLPSE
jgi:hypothetical protein